MSLPEVGALGRRPASATTGHPADAVLRIPHPALLIGGSLGFLAVVTALAARYQVRMSGTWQVGTVLTLATAILAALVAVVLLGIRRAHTMPATLVGLLVLDAAPVVMQVGALTPADARARVLFLVIPTVIAAATLSAGNHRVHLVGVMVIAAAMVGVPATGRSPVGRIVETCLAVGVLLAADLLVRRLSTATANRIFALRTLSLTDELTGVLNRRGLAAGFGRLVRSARRDATIGLLIVDIDHFKWFNDEYGHAAGDDVLRRVCQVLKTTAGQGNLVARIGGEELAALVVGRAEPVALAFREALAAVRPTVTASIGVIDVPLDATVVPGALWQMLDAADQALYEAKNTGRDRICRGELDSSAVVEQPVIRAPAEAAVPAEGIVATLAPSRLPGWALAVLGLLGLLSVLGRTSVALGRPIDWVYLVVALACLVTGIVVIGTAPRLTQLRLLGGVVGVDLVVAVSVLDLTYPAGRLIALLPLLLTGLMVAQNASRVMLVGHHVIILTVCLLAFEAPVTPLTAVAVCLHAAVLIGSAELIFRLRRRHDEAASDLHRWSVTDPLTGLANRRGLELAFARMPRTHNITVLALDVDDFKAVNDRHGHAIGDDALIRLAATLRTVTGSDTVVGRTGGDEFVVLAPSTHAGQLASTVTTAAGLLPVPLSVSVGSTVVAPYHRQSLWQFVAAADAGLTRAKQARRAARDGDGVTTDDTMPRAGLSAAPPRGPLGVAALGPVDDGAADDPPARQRAAAEG
jgi:diguanylate cyclase (GGDEF)-like protein